MRGVSKKMFISILTSVIVFVTMVATTFAWVGIFTYASTDNFKINLRVSELDSNYYLTISDTGQVGSFTDEIPAINLKRQIIKSRYNTVYDNSSDTVIEKVFDEITLAPATTQIDNNSFKPFTKIDVYNPTLTLVNCNDYYKFDLYLSVDTKEGITSSTTGIKTNVLLTNLEEMLMGTICSGKFLNSNPFGDLPSTPINDLLKNIPNEFSVNSKNACRVGFSIYEPIGINEQYQGDEKPIKSMIYQGGNELPTYDINNDVYDLGGCLPEDQNTALRELKVVRSSYSLINPPYYYSLIDEACNRGDLVINEENSEIWNRNEHTSYLGVMDGVQTKMKLSVYFWFEGWDSDCFRTIIEQPVSLNLTFTAGIED